MRELVQKQQGEFNAQILQYQAREKEQEEAIYQAGLDKQKFWEQERQKEKAEWVERQRVWEQEKKGSKLSGKQRKRHSKKRVKESSKKESGDGLKS